MFDIVKVVLDDVGFKGLFFGGNYVFGVVLGRCVEGVYEVVVKVVDFFL